MALLTGGLALLGILATAGPAAAHAALTGSDPADGSVVRDAPRQVTLDFSEGVAMSDDSIRVLDPHGKRADTGAIRDTGTGGKTQRAVSLKSSLSKGTYTVAWQAVSADSHPVSGAFTFSVKEPSETSATVPQQDENAGGGAVGTLYGIGRYAAYAGFVLLVGGAGFVMLCAPRAASSRAVQRLTVTGWVTLTAATLALLLLRTPYTGSGRLADVLDLGGLKEVVATKPGTALVSRMLLLAAAALFVSVLFGAYARRRKDGAVSTDGAADTDGAAGSDEPVGARERHDLLYGLAIGGTVVAAGLAATWAMAEHASTGIQTSLAMPVDILHLLAVALWLGGLAALFCLLRWGPSPSGTAVRRFSAVALTSVTVLAATGLYQSWRQVGTLDALTSTSYGQLLLVKVALVAVLVGIGWFSRRWTARLSEVPTETTAVQGEATEVPREAENGRTESVRTDIPARTASLPHTRSPQPPVRASAPSSSLSSDSASAEDPSGDGTADPVRAAQLARQRDAADAAQQRKRREADPQRSGLRRSVLTEASIAVVLLAVTTILTNTEPGRTEAQAHAAGNSGTSASAGPVEAKVPFDTGGPGGKGTAALTLDPGSRGRNTLQVHTTAPGGRPLDAPEVKVTFTLPAKDLGPLPVTLKPVAGKKGHWKATDVRLPMAGEWKLALTVRTSDIDQVTTYKTATIG
ncbi:copper resistance protein CopC [Streptomyces diacarni]|uniref:copper resistance protein CopC n=1 Tax=Streptomyces diacarni TaxID=2800381 RepID=UPI0033EC014F